MKGTPGPDRTDGLRFRNPTENRKKTRRKKPLEAKSGPSPRWFVRFRYEGVWFRSEVAFGERKGQRIGDAVSRGDGRLGEIQLVIPQGFRTRLTRKAATATRAL